jgi:hypothetical protein
VYTQTAHRIANKIRLRRQVFSGTIIIVEGDTDARLYGKFISKETCEIEIAWNKENALQVNEILTSESIEGIIIIADSDFDRLEGLVHKYSNVFLTDYHDLELMLIFSPALDKVLWQYGSENKLRKIPRPRELLINAAFPIGLLRWISSKLQRNLSLDFDGIRFRKFIDKTTLEININRLVQIVVSRSIINDSIANELKPKVKELLQKGLDKSQICVGHDLVEILLIGFRRKLGSTNNLDLVSLDNALRIAYDFNCFSSSSLFSRLMEWQITNGTYKIFSSPN